MNIFYLFRAVLGSEQNEAEGREISHILLAPMYAYCPPLSASPSKVVYLSQLIMNWHHDHPESTVCIKFHSWCCAVYNLNKSKMTCIYHYSIKQSNFTALKCSSENLHLVLILVWEGLLTSKTTRISSTVLRVLIHIFKVLILLEFLFVLVWGRVD